MIPTKYIKQRKRKGYTMRKPFDTL
jgi:hypothetical protein